MLYNCYGNHKDSYDFMSITRFLDIAERGLAKSKGLAIG